jgi:hypothetical protein
MASVAVGGSMHNIIKKTNMEKIAVPNRIWIRIFDLLALLITISGEYLP